MNKTENGVARFKADTRRSAFKSEQQTLLASETSERWNSDVEQSREAIAAQIIDSVKSKWGTAVALEAATGISPTEISRIRHGKLARFSLERLVRLLWIVDPEVDVKLRVNVVRKSRAAPKSEKRKRST